MGENDKVELKDIIREARRKNRNIDKAMIEKAYKYAAEKHKDQRRKSGEPYIIHPMHVAYIVARFGLDTPTICAALLHDVVEDTDATYEDIEEMFNVEVAEIVEGVTKLTQLFITAEEKQAENFKKMFIAMEKDIRVILLKLADRLHNISTLQYLKKDRQLAIAKETVEFYAPIAHKLGMYDLKMKLQDNSFQYLHPESYKKITKELEKKIEDNKEYLDRTKLRIEKELKKERIAAIISVETKHLYNIYKKMKQKNCSMDQLKDLFSIKIITKNKRDCYKVLGLINNKFTMIPKTFVDYIAVPRNNMYQAIHEIIIGERGVIVEAQICSYEMNIISKYGITSYYRHLKTNKSHEENEFLNKLAGVHETLELNNLTGDPNVFLNTLKDELFDDEVYVFTPKGNIIALPKGSTALDFAYYIHTNMGRQITGCKINSVNMPITTKLKNGNIVEILAGNSDCMPNREWLDCVKTAKARREIISLLKEYEGKEKNKYLVKVEAKDKINLVLDITKIFAIHKLNILVFNTDINNDDVKIEIVVETRKVEKIETVKEKLLEIPEIEDIKIEDYKEE